MGFNSGFKGLNIPSQFAEEKRMWWGGVSYSRNRGVTKLLHSNYTEFTIYVNTKSFPCAL